MLPVEFLNEASLPQLPPRRPDCHKGQLGHVLVVAGGAGMGGAGLLASQAGLRLGAGLVTLATVAEHVGACLARQPEVMVRPVHDAQELQPLLQQASVVLAGPGMGQGDWAQALLAAVAGSDCMQIWDADALNLLAQDNGRWSAPRQWLLTPHPGEAARLLDCPVRQVQADRPRAAQQLARRYSAVVVLKGARTLIAGGQGLRECPYGHPVMAGAGFGDILGGVIAALAAQGLTLFDAACLAVYIHARAGELCSGSGRGLAASDLLAPMRQLLEQLCPVMPDR